MNNVQTLMLQTSFNRYARGAGKPVGYKLIPQVGPALLAAEGGFLANKTKWASKHLWVTPYEPTEKWPGGDYPLQSDGSQVCTHNARLDAEPLVVSPCLCLFFLNRCLASYSKQ